MRKHLQVRTGPSAEEEHAMAQAQAQESAASAGADWALDEVCWGLGNRAKGVERRGCRRVLAPACGVPGWLGSRGLLPRGEQGRQGSWQAFGAPAGACSAGCIGRVARWLRDHPDGDYACGQ